MFCRRDKEKATSRKKCFFCKSPSFLLLQTNEDQGRDRRGLCLDHPDLFHEEVGWQVQGRALVRAQELAAWVPVPAWEEAGAEAALDVRVQPDSGGIRP